MIRNRAELDACRSEYFDGRFRGPSKMTLLMRSLEEAFDRIEAAEKSISEPLEFLLTDLSGRGFTSKVTADHLRNYTDDKDDQQMIYEWLVSASTGDELRLESEATKITRI